MCGRFTLTVGTDFLKEAFEASSDFNWNESFNIAPTQEVVSIVYDGSQNRLGKMGWGLVPSWAKDQKMQSKMINARLETADEKPSFKRLMARRRCLIVADSFYEWVKDEQGNKQPVRIYMPNRQLFTFAGLWDRWEKDGEQMVTCTILTKEANEYVSDIHHRMPVILPKEAEQTWIDFEPKDPTEMKKWILGLDSEPLAYHPVSTYVNSPRNNDEQCIEKV
ncbi:SOS response-associated peptidase [Halalkalibacillus halophilus]|uniref:SOS response-associated peptidase n=1 Tax=Halalkalibacillus halophilus TaxID=392827 RepID=UPI0003FCB9BF|nr:SOS response-associated peptidase [Halalkalibacillus halophilus]